MRRENKSSHARPPPPALPERRDELPVQIGGQPPLVHLACRSVLFQLYDPDCVGSDRTGRGGTGEASCVARIVFPAPPSRLQKNTTQVLLLMYVVRSGISNNNTMNNEIIFIYYLLLLFVVVIIIIKHMHSQPTQGARAAPSDDEEKLRAGGIGSPLPVLRPAPRKLRGRLQLPACPAAAAPS